MPAVSTAQRSRRRARLFLAGGAFVVFDSGQNGPGRSLNPTQGLRQCGAVASIEVDVVARRIGHVESNRLANDESDRFGFEFPCITRSGRSLLRCNNSCAYS